VHGPSSTVPYDGIEDTAGYAIGVLALPLLLIASGLSVTSLVVRYRRSSGVVRQQIRWIAWGGAILVISMVWVLVGQGMEGNSGGGIAALIALAGEVLLILSIAIAITRYRLYEIDVVISRTVTYGALALFITAVYVAIVVGVGTLVGQGDEPNLALAIVATAVVALLFQPVRSRVQRWVNRLVYGDRASPYAVLSELTARLSEADSNEQALKRLAELIESGTGAKEAIVWLRVGDHFRPEATSGEAPQVDPSNGDAHPFMFGDTLVTELTAVPGDAAEPIHHGGELLGVLSIRKGKADPVTRADHDLLRDVAAGSGLLLRNIQLNAELADRAEELRLSRRRLVAAQDSERRRLERKGCSARYLSTARTRRLVCSSGERSSLVKIELMCFSTAPSEMNSASATPALLRPLAISASTSVSRSVSRSRIDALRALTSRSTTSGSMTDCPRSTSSIAAFSCSRSATFSLSR
jgi:hypothetical protein